MFAGKALRCDCGYEVQESTEDACVVAIQRHAREAHGIDFSVELALEVARREAASSDGEQVELEQIGINEKEKQ
jgi:predicted small metal-binding protein